MCDNKEKCNCTILKSRILKLEKIISWITDGDLQEIEKDYDFFLENRIMHEAQHDE